MAGKGVRIWAKKQLRLEPLTIRQREMVQIGSAGLLSLFKRLAQSKGPEDAPAKPLKKGYAILKTRKGKGNQRNLFLTGQMLSSLKLRTVNDNRAYSSVGADMRAESRLLRKKDKSSRKLTNKDVAWVNQRREPWLVFSPENKRAIFEKARQILIQIKEQLVSKG
jgi:hypothetical protein